MRQNLQGVVLLVDSRRVQDSDRGMVEWLEQLKIPMVVVATKADKVTRGKRHATVRELRDGLGIEEDPIFLSAHSGEGKQMVLDRVRDLLAVKTSPR
jgi:GTP-binding protein